MAFDGRIFRVLIASPSDVEEEREIAVRVIQEWNDLNAYSRQVALLPLRWETHSAPEYGIRPQEVINRVIVDECDLLIGIFWTRIGTPTGTAESGTLEEIERVAGSGKPVMLYFSKVGIDPDSLDLGQVSRLKTFKEKTYPNALAENYKSRVEFRDKLARQIELKVRDLQKADDSGDPTVSFEFFDQETETIQGTALTKCLEVPNVTNIEFEVNRLKIKDSEKLKKLVRDQVKRKSTVPVLLAISNSGSYGVRNVYAEISAEVVSGKARVTNKEESHSFSMLLHSWAGLGRNELAYKSEEGKTWSTSFEWGAIQPKRIRKVDSPIQVEVEEDCEVKFTARVFADSFPQPVELTAKLKINVTRTDTSLDSLFPELELLVERMQRTISERDEDSDVKLVTVDLDAESNSKTRNRKSSKKNVSDE